MKAIMLTIRLKWFYLTYKGIKTIEVRKSAPKDFVGDVFEVVIKTNFEKDLMEIPENEREFFKQFKGKVGLKFTLKEIRLAKYQEQVDGKSKLANKLTCLTDEELDKYLNKKNGYGWVIDDLVIFDKPKEISEFKVNKKYWCDKCPYQYGICLPKCEELKPLTKAPQSWQFIEGEDK